MTGRRALPSPSSTPYELRPLLVLHDCEVKVTDYPVIKAVMLGDRATFADVAKVS